MPEPKTKEYALRRIRALFALAESERKDGHAKAAEDIAARANEMLLTFKLSMSDVERAAQDATDPIDAEFVAPPDFGEEIAPGRVKWTEDLASVIANAHFCKVTVSENNNAVCFYGRESDRKVAAFIFAKLARMAKKFCETETEAAVSRLIPFAGGKWLRAETSGGGSFNGFTFDTMRMHLDLVTDLDFFRASFRESWHFGFASALFHRFAQMRAQAEAKETGNALIFKGAMDAVEKYVAEQTGGKDAAPVESAAKRKDQFAVERGVRAGRNADISANGLAPGVTRNAGLLTGGENNNE